mmetsp:Transcript_55161/g.139310  ORF Transcript_55161/g.139310 Transcript_55161/m.139310 type:complete len:133 (-) Transcript_55161:245-643(-)|eukprot:CAMPEP_0115228188 /NCGR_PEP_ID=MMETSP0270-20121206/31539_1 /TAXON_ID=71861 /ORGANISM="Scrippsiella trochoidea, Strain CCMP3099" /LENGTH=132 /DNA_ID=CAMNT_0002642677 /DNA_START=79 /DNA_END=477 /DNA_ORIENTATION=+
MAAPMADEALATIEERWPKFRLDAGQHSSLNDLGVPFPIFTQTLDSLPITAEEAQEPSDGVSPRATMKSDGGLSAGEEELERLEALVISGQVDEEIRRHMKKRELRSPTFTVAAEDEAAQNSQDASPSSASK